MSDGTVLIVDDEPAIRKLLTRVAASCGYESLTASNGHEAIVMSRDSKINLILLDIMMNGNDEGFEVIRRLRASGNEIPIIVLSGRTEDFDTLYLSLIHIYLLYGDEGGCRRRRYDDPGTSDCKTAAVF